MSDRTFSILTLAHAGAIYAGQWCHTPYSVTVRYKQREVSISSGGARQKEMAKALLTELVEADSRLRRRDVA